MAADQTDAILIFPSLSHLIVDFLVLLCVPLSLSVLAAMQQATTATPAPPWCTAAAPSTAYTHMESSGAFR